MAGLALADNDCRACRNFCLRIEATLDRTERPSFMSAVVSFMQIDYRFAIAFFAAREREYLTSYFLAF
jgi:hypothetical protein